MIWQLLQSTRDADGLAFLPMVTFKEARGPYKVPDGEGRIKLYSWVTALHEVTDADLADVVGIAQQIQAERDERYFRAGLLRQAARRLTKQRAAQQMDELAAQLRAEEADYRARAAQVEAYLCTLSADEYQALAATAEAELKELVPTDKRILWLPEAWAASVRQRVLQQLLEAGWPDASKQQLCA